MKAEVEREQSIADAKRYIEKNLLLAGEFQNPPKIKLKLITRTLPGEAEVDPVDIVSSTGAQCYNPGTTEIKHRESVKFDNIAANTLDSGHHTLRQHLYVTFGIENVSRDVIHDLFHEFIFYNSDQQSQRYADIVLGSYYVPTRLSEKCRLLYVNSADFTNQQFTRFETLIRPEIDRRMKQMNPETAWHVDKTRERLEGKAGKLTQEIARYLLPIGQFSKFNYTIDELQLLRLLRNSEFENYSSEAKYIVAEMASQVLELHPKFEKELRRPLGKLFGNTLSINEEYISVQKAEFDNSLDGKLSKMHGFGPEIRRELAKAVRNVMGVPESIMSDEVALQRVLDPANNKLLADVYEPGILDPLTSALRMVLLSFDTKLSHTADSQRQRHRGTPAATPTIMQSYDGRPDYMIPLVVRENDQLLEEYCRTMEEIYRNVERCVDAGIPKREALMLLPNAHALRVTESGDLFDWIHRFKQRSCFLAQEEIFFISLEQMDQFLKVIPEAEQILKAPCAVRKRALLSPPCPEGDRFCGKPVFRMKLEEYSKSRLL